MRADVVVIGAGTAGAGVAYQCARRGLRVVCLDARPLDRAGARWVNGVPSWQLEAAGVPSSPPGELRSGVTPFHLVAGYGPERVVIDDHGVLDLDMRALVARLQELARGEGAELLGETQVRGLEGARLETTRGTFEAEVFVDASGLGGARLIETVIPGRANSLGEASPGQDSGLVPRLVGALPRRHPVESVGHAPGVAREHLCAAAQSVHRVRDVAAARDFFARHGVREGEVLCFSGIAGGYSIVNVRLHDDELSVLTGSIPALGHPSGQLLLDGFVQEHAWVGERIFGGARAIPLRRPFERLAHGRVALVGDAASQVFPAHGSGIGIGLLAGRMIAEAIAEGRGLSGYERAFQRRYGGLLAAYDVFRRFSQELTSADVAALMRAGLLDATTAGAGLAQAWPKLDPALVRDKARGALESPRLAARLSSVLAKMGALSALYRAYPSSRGRRFRAWSRAVARLFGE